MSLNVSLYVEVDTGGPLPHTCDLYDANYTHNCAKMASEAGIYEYVWRPHECVDVKCAGDLIDPLRRGIDRMLAEPQRFIALNPENGWGSYDTFVPWLEKYLNACQNHPKAQIYVSR
jgi:beta-galactosidase/beta-glucuronidase